jgi:hypothetical protein
MAWLLVRCADGWGRGRQQLVHRLRQAVAERLAGGISSTLHWRFARHVGCHHSGGGGGVRPPAGSHQHQIVVELLQRAQNLIARFAGEDASGSEWPGPSCEAND